MIGRHPHKFAIAAWFDGEGSESTGGHIARCGRCRRHAADLARVRSWLRAQPFVAMTDEVGEPERARHHRRPVMVAVLLLFAYLIAPNGGDGDLGRSGRNPLAALEGPDSGKTDAPSPPVGEPGIPAPDPLLQGGEAAPSVGSGRRNASNGARESAPGAAQLPPWSAPLKLGLVVPMSGPLAQEGVEVREVVQRRVQAANSSGGVAGVRVELVVAPAEDPAALDAMASSVSVIVGGFGSIRIDTPTPWIFPADPLVTGPNIVPAEASARTVGAQLAASLRNEGPLRLIGIIVGSGPDAELAGGLASKANVTTVNAKKNTSCIAEVATMRHSGAMTLAIAGDTDLVANCVRAAARSPWQPRLGPLVPPSAAYAGIASLSEATGARTVLALPWPSSAAPGAARFRATTTSQSYRALVSYAATELAIDVARQTGTVSLASMAGRTWRSDLVEVDGVTIRAGGVVSSLFGDWIALP